MIGQRLGPYEVLAILGEGGMGAVYRARDTRLDREVAIKVPSKDVLADPLAVERFQREARAASSLSHPNICTIFDVGGDPPFLAMELLEGETLQQRLARSGPLDVTEIIEVAASVAEGLEAAHAKGLVHRDIKPANIFLTAHGPKILDFGLAKAALSTAADGLTRSALTPVTEVGTTVGTIAYMSPEQLRGRDLDTRSDLFSFGLVIYEMATGKAAFPGETAAVISAAILHTPPVPPRRLRTDLPSRLEDVILKALEKDRDDRYQTASDLRADLRRVRRELDGQASDGTIGAPAAKPRLSLARITAATALAAALVAIGGWLMFGGRAATAPPSPADLQFEALTNTGNAELPAISNDGRFLAFVQRDGTDTSLWIRQTTTNRNVRIVDAVPGQRIFAVTVAPDGTFVDFVRGLVPDVALWRVPFLGGTPHKLIDDVWTPIGWSPDGRQFAFVRTLTDGSAIIVANADGSGSRALLTTDAAHALNHLASGSGATATAPSWSPDGHRIVVRGWARDAGGAPDAEQIVVVDVASGQAEWVPLRMGAHGGVAFLDAETFLINQEAEIGSPIQLWRMDAPTGRLSRLTNDLSDYTGLSLVADHRAVVTARVDKRVGVWKTDAVGRNPTEVVPMRSSPGSLAERVGWSGARLLFTMGTSIAAVVPGGDAPVEIVRGGTTPSGSADGRTILYRSLGLESGNAGLWKTDGDGRQPERLLPQSVTAVVTPDGAGFVYISGPPLQTAWFATAGGGPGRPLSKLFVPALAIDVSRDGSRVLFSEVAVRGTETDSSFVVCDLPACASRQTLPGPPRGLGRIRLTPDGRGVAYIEPSARNIWIQPLDGRASYTLTQFTDLSIADFAFSADGAHLAIARTSTRRDIVMVRGLR